MLGAMLEVLAEYEGVALTVRTAGTHAIEGAAISGRTRDALLAIDAVRDVPITRHRSRMVTREDLEWADLVLASEAAHVRLMRQWFPDTATKAVQLRALTASESDTLAHALATLALSEPDDALDVRDPAGGDQAVYDACARELWDLAQVVLREYLAN
jgi:protein-tyrosine-phosphatase